ncbi:MAG: thiamine pyrophosphate-binding protein, partial [Bacteroidota bacterium]
MKYSKIPLSQTVVELCKAYQIQHVVISPGSRSAPLTIGFTNDSYFKCYSIVDERCAGFFALGIAQQIGKPVALICTSGSALLNYYPAISEAYYSNIPMIVLSADRPKHLVDIGDGQTIKQSYVYGDHVLYSTNLKLDLRGDDLVNDSNSPQIIQSIKDKTERFLGITEDIQSYNEKEINAAIGKSVLKSGPVHINCPFNEPLYETTEERSVNVTATIPSPALDHISEEELSSCIDSWQNADRKVVLVGVNSPEEIKDEWLNRLAQDDSVIVFTETTSNIHHNEFFPSIDKIIAPLEENNFRALQPDILITFGGMVVSKKIKAFLRTYQPKQHWHIGKNRANDTFFCLNKHIQVSPDYFFESLLPKVSLSESDYKPSWIQVKAKRALKHEAYLDEIPFCDFLVFDRVLKTIPDHYQLQVGNSSAIRYTQLFDVNPTLHVFCNRGTSGIDGSTSTAVGAAVVSESPV